MPKQLNSPTRRVQSDGQIDRMLCAVEATGETGKRPIAAGLAPVQLARRYTDMLLKLVQSQEAFLLPADLRMNTE